MEVKDKKEVAWGSFTKDLIVSVKPIESQGKWGTLLVKGQEMRKDPYIYNKAKRSYQVPLRSISQGGGVKVILDDQKRVMIKKYHEKYKEGMTQKEFFENELGVDLNTTTKGMENFWRYSNLGRVTLTKEGLSLNLNLSIDMLKYLILISNTTLISPSFEDRILKASYEFMIVDESKTAALEVSEAEAEADAYVKYAEITRNTETTIGFIKSLGRAIPATATDNWLKLEVLKVLKAGPTKFLDIVNHPHFEGKIFVQEAVEAGALLRKSKDRYTLDNGIELGDLTSTINYLNDPEHQEVKMRVKARIELYKGK